MLKNLIKSGPHLTKHLEEPLLNEREAFLKFLSQNGFAKSTLLIKAGYLLHIARLLGLRDNSNRIQISLADIDAAAEKWSSMSQSGKPRTSPSTKELFSQTAISWLLHMGRMEKRYTRTIRACGDLHLPGIIRKYLETPFFEERMSYLEHMRNNGFKPYVIRKAAISQLHLIDFLHLNVLRKVGHSEIEDAVLKWSNVPNISKNKIAGNVLALNRFKWHAINWLKYLNLYEAPKEYIPWEEMLMSYLDYITEDLGYSKATRSQRYYMLRKFLHYVKVNGSSPQTLTLSLIDAYFNELSKDSKLNRISCSNVATGLRSFVKYLALMRWCPQELEMGIKSPRQYRLGELPSSPDWEIVKDMVRSKNTDYTKDIRDHAILLLLSVYSLRCSEIINLKLRDINWRAETITFLRAKDCKPQVFPLKKEVGDAIIRYIKEVRPNHAKLDYIFLCIRAPYRKLPSASIYTLVSTELKNRGVELDHYGPHTIRKAGATHMINNGINLKIISTHLGHQQLDTTCIYAKVDLCNLRKVADMDWKEVLS